MLIQQHYASHIIKVWIKKSWNCGLKGFPVGAFEICCRIVAVAIAMFRGEAKQNAQHTKEGTFFT